MQDGSNIAQEIRESSSEEKKMLFEVTPER